MNVDSVSMRMVAKTESEKAKSIELQIFWAQDSTWLNEKT